MQGLTLILIAAQIVLTVRVPRPIGYAMAFAGITYIAQGVIVRAEGFSSNGTIPGLLAFVLDLAWMISLVVLAWQKPCRVRSLATTRPSFRRSRHERDDPSPWQGWQPAGRGGAAGATGAHDGARRRHQAEK
jgi:hypothetical protein